MSESALYEACRDGDLDTVQQLLLTLSVDEINQFEPNGSTSLHAACSCNHPRIVKLLLDHGIVRWTLDKNGRTALDEAATEQIKQLFSRSFTATQARFFTDIPHEQPLEWASLEYGCFGWRNKSRILNEDVAQAVDSIMQDERFHDAASTHKMEYFLEKARRTQDPKWLVQAYSAEIGLSQIMNRALAQAPSFIVNEDAERDFRSFAGVFFHHKALKQYRYSGKCYRGMKLADEDFEKNYKVGQKILIKPFMSTSKRRHIAEQFAIPTSADSRRLSILCIYIIPERTLLYNDNVALDISLISEYPHEEEVLVLPYTSLKIQSVSHLPSGLIEIELEWYSFLADARLKYKNENLSIKSVHNI